jgi:hypothetical protein
MVKAQCTFWYNGRWVLFRSVSPFPVYQVLGIINGKTAGVATDAEQLEGQSVEELQT